NEWADRKTETAERKHPVKFAAATAQSEITEINLPDGWIVDELPPKVETDIGAISYGSRIEGDGAMLRYQRKMEIKDLLLKTGQLSDFKKFNQQVTAGESGAAVLRRR